MLKFKQLLAQINEEVKLDKKISDISPYMSKKLEKEYNKISERVSNLDMDSKVQAIKELNEKTKEHLKEKYLKLVNNIYTQEFMRTRDKYGFVFGILNLMFTAFLLGHNPMMYVTWYTIKYIPLACIRWLRYLKKKWILYTFDFCYYANFILIMFIYFGQNNPYIFNTCYLYCFGPIIWAIPIFRNSLVLHSLDRITSCVLHFAAPLACYCIKWSDKDNIYGQRDIQHINLLMTYSYAVSIYLMWALTYYIIVFIGLRSKLQIYDNTYVYSMGNKSIKKFCFSFGEKYHTKMYMCFHILYFLGTSTIAVLQFRFQIINFIIMAYCCLIAIWNGANFYMVWFSKKYEKQLAMLEIARQEKNLKKE